MVEVEYTGNSMPTFYIRLLDIIVDPRAYGWMNMPSPSGLPEGYASALGLRPMGGGTCFHLRACLRAMLLPEGFSPRAEA